jgi:hypothetical protein
VIESSEHVDQPVRLTLRRTSLANPDRLLYEALSYCWGDGYEVVPISLVDDAGSLVELLVSSNLEHAIRRIRQPDKDRLFWIDLLSINQNDMAERSQQVAMMSEIYASAQSVCVWIGEIDEIVHTQKDIEVIQTVAVSCAPDKTREEAHSTVLDINGNTNWFNDRGSSVFGSYKRCGTLHQLFQPKMMKDDIGYLSSVASSTYHGGS